MRRVSLANDIGFGEDGGVRELGQVSGSIGSGYGVGLTVPV